MRREWEEVKGGWEEVREGRWEEVRGGWAQGECLSTVYFVRTIFRKFI